MSTPTIYLDDCGVSRAALQQRAARAARGFDALGIREGDSLALLLRNDFAFLEVQQAAAMIGAYSVPINWHGKADEVRYILSRQSRNQTGNTMGGEPMAR